MVDLKADAHGKSCFQKNILYMSARMVCTSYSYICTHMLIISHDDVNHLNQKVQQD